MDAELMDAETLVADSMPATSSTAGFIRPILVRRPPRPKFSEMSMQDIFDWNHRRRETLAAPPITGPYMPPPPASQSELEAWVNGFVRTGGMSPESGEKLLAGMARSRVKRPPPPPPSHETEAPETEAKARRVALDTALLKADIPAAFWGLRLNVNPFQTEEGEAYLFDPDNVNRRAFFACRLLARDWQPGAKGLTLRSPDVGVGKTLFAYAALIYITAHHTGRTGKGCAGKSRARCQVVSGKALLDLLRSSYGATWEKNPGVLSTEAVRQKYMSVPDVLLIDDLGKENVRTGEAGEWARAELLDLLDYRMEHRLTTLITTNLTEADTLTRYGLAFASRLLGRSPAVEMQGADFRLGQAASPDADPFAYDGEFDPA